MSTALEQVTETLQSRGKDYGNPEYGARQLGRMWAATLSENLLRPIPDIPAHVVLLMMSQLKISRAARPHSFKQDNYVDGIGYLHLAETVATCPDPTRNSGGSGVPDIHT